MINIIEEKYPVETMQARRDFAEITGKKIVELPYWFTDDDTGKEYHSFFSAIGWPQRIAETGAQREGYGVVIGIDKGADAESATFRIMEEVEDQSVEILLAKCIKMRKRWGFGLHPTLLRVFMGDHRLFEMVVADFNTRMIDAGGDDRKAAIVSPPDDYDNPQAFDIYLRRLQTVLSPAPGAKRLFVGSAAIFKNRIQDFRRDEPAVMAVGGLVHTLLLRTPWMEQSVPSVFAVDF